VLWKTLLKRKALILPLELYDCISIFVIRNRSFMLSNQLLRSGTGIGANVAKGQQ